MVPTKPKVSKALSSLILGTSKPMKKALASIFKLSAAYRKAIPIRATITPSRLATVLIFPISNTVAATATMITVNTQVGMPVTIKAKPEIAPRILPAS